MHGPLFFPSVENIKTKVNLEKLCTFLIDCEQIFYMPMNPPSRVDYYLAIFASLIEKMISEPFGKV